MQYYIKSSKYNKGKQDLANWHGFTGEKKEVQFRAISLSPQLTDENLYPEDIKNWTSNLPFCKQSR